MAAILDDILYILSVILDDKSEMKYSKCDSNDIVSKTANQFNITCQMQSLCKITCFSGYWPPSWIPSCISKKNLWWEMVDLTCFEINVLHTNISKENIHMWYHVAQIWILLLLRLYLGCHLEFIYYHNDDSVASFWILQMGCLIYKIQQREKH